MIDRSHRLPLARQARELGISRGSVYYLPKPVSAADLAIMRRMDELHLEFPFAGSRMLRDLLRQEGIAIGRQHVATLMKKMAIEAIYRRPNTSKPAPGHKVYPYLLRKLPIVRPNQVWATDISYVPMAKGFVYLVAIGGDYMHGRLLLTGLMAAVAPIAVVPVTARIRPVRSGSQERGPAGYASAARAFGVLLVLGSSAGGSVWRSMLIGRAPMRSTNIRSTVASAACACRSVGAWPMWKPSGSSAAVSISANAKGVVPMLGPGAGECEVPIGVSMATRCSSRSDRHHRTLMTAITTVPATTQ